MKKETGRPKRGKGRKHLLRAGDLSWPLEGEDNCSSKEEKLLVATEEGRSPKQKRKRVGREPYDGWKKSLLSFKKNGSSLGKKVSASTTGGKDHALLLRKKRVPNSFKVLPSREEGEY